MWSNKLQMQMQWLHSILVMILGLTWACYTRIPRMITVVSSESIMRTTKYAWLTPSTSNIVQKDVPRSSANCRVCTTRVTIPQASADYVCINQVPVVFADSSPSPVVENLHSTFVRGPSVDYSCIWFKLTFWILLWIYLVSQHIQQYKIAWLITIHQVI